MIALSLAVFNPSYLEFEFVGHPTHRILSLLLADLRPGAICLFGLQLAKRRTMLAVDPRRNTAAAWEAYRVVILCGEAFP
jgi:hypothetical protein